MRAGFRGGCPEVAFWGPKRVILTSCGVVEEQQRGTYRAGTEVRPGGGDAKVYTIIKHSLFV